MTKIISDVEIDQNVKELNDFILVMDAKINIGEQQSVLKALTRIKEDMKKHIERFEKKCIDFHEAYEEITSLHVFAEMYLTPDITE